MSDGEGTVTFGEFLQVEIRVGRVTAVDDFPEARKPAWKLTIDFGPQVGTKRSSAQIKHYPREALEGRLVVAVVTSRLARSARSGPRCWCWARSTTRRA